LYSAFGKRVKEGGREGGRDGPTIMNPMAVGAGEVIGSPPVRREGGREGGVEEEEEEEACCMSPCPSSPPM